MSIEAGNTSGWAPGKAFEYLVLRAFQLEGAEVRWPYSVRIDGGEKEFFLFHSVSYDGTFLFKRKVWLEDSP
jgi:hypothetical protein